MWFFDALDLGVVGVVGVIVIILRLGLGLPVDLSFRLVKLLWLLPKMLVEYDMDEIATYACLDFGPGSSRRLIDEIGVEGTGSTRDRRKTSTAALGIAVAIGIEAGVSATGCRLRIPGLLERNSPIVSSKLDQPIFVIVGVVIIGVDQGTSWNRGAVGQGNATTIAMIGASVVIMVALPLSASFSRLQPKKILTASEFVTVPSRQ